MLIRDPEAPQSQEATVVLKEKEGGSSEKASEKPD